MTGDIPHPLCLYFLVVVEIELPINDFPASQGLACATLDEMIVEFKFVEALMIPI